VEKDKEIAENAAKKCMMYDVRCMMFFNGEYFLLQKFIMAEIK